ncbi:MAG: hypothetical protein QM808_16695, partial [Steroidobacteraceae bacterium]
NSSQLLQPNTSLGGVCLGAAAADVDGDVLPDLLFSCQTPSISASTTPAVGSIYVNNGTATPFTNVAPVSIPATTNNDYGRSVAVGTLIQNGVPDVLVVGGGVGLAGYYPITLAQNPSALNDSAVCAVSQQIQINVLANDVAAQGQN